MRSSCTWYIHMHTYTYVRVRIPAHKNDVVREWKFSNSWFGCVALSIIIGAVFCTVTSVYAGISVCFVIVVDVDVVVACNRLRIMNVVDVVSGWLIYFVCFVLFLSYIYPHSRLWHSLISTKRCTHSHTVVYIIHTHTYTHGLIHLACVI